MAKAVLAKVKLQCPAGQAAPAPPVGPALGQHGINIGQFVNQFNERTRKEKKWAGLPITAVITIYKDRSFEFELRGPTVAALLKQAAGIAKGSGVPNREKVGKVTKEQIREIAQEKFQYLNARDIEQAMKIVEGTARSMGIEVVEG